MTGKSDMGPNLVEIASLGNFTLYDRVGKSSAEWRNLRLIRFGNAPKNNWWFGWNGERLASNRDAGLLKENDPHVYDWVVTTLSETQEWRVA